MSKAPRSARSFEKIEDGDLERLAEIAVATLRREFERRPNMPAFEEGELLGICLCLGAADHYLDYQSRKSCGIHDFDVFAFFEPQKVFRFGNKRPATADFGPSKFGRSRLDPKRFTGRRVDVFWRAIPNKISLDPMGPVDAYFRDSESATASELRTRAAVVIWPWDNRGRVLWNPHQLGKPASYDPWD